MMDEKEKGFIALFSVIVISTVLLLVATTLSFSGFFGRFNVLDTESKSRSDELAEACIEYATLQLANDNTFTVSDEEVEVGTEKCNYDVASGGKINSRAEVNSAHTYFYAEVDLSDPSLPITDFEECLNLSPCP
jgi:hypothetical protein